MKNKAVQDNNGLPIDALDPVLGGVYQVAKPLLDFSPKIIRSGKWHTCDFYFRIDRKTKTVQIDEFRISSIRREKKCTNGS